MAWFLSPILDRPLPSLYNGSAAVTHKCDMDGFITFLLTAETPRAQSATRIFRTLRSLRLSGEIWVITGKGTS